MFSEGLVIMTPNRKYLNCPSLLSLWYNNVMEYCLAIKRNKLLMLVTAWLNLKYCAK